MLPIWDHSSAFARLVHRRSPIEPISESSRLRLPLSPFGMCLYTIQNRIFFFYLSFVGVPYCLFLLIPLSLNHVFFLFVWIFPSLGPRQRNTAHAGHTCSKDNGDSASSSPDYLHLPFHYLPCIYDCNCILEKNQVFDSFFALLLLLLEDRLVRVSSHTTSSTNCIR